MRIISINDVYELDNLSRLRTLVEVHRAGLPRENVLVTLAGDFLAPSLLSSLDGGHGMVKVLNLVPVDIVCFGNHESDIPYQKLVQRIEEFQGSWLNSNMPRFEPDLPRYMLRRLRGKAGDQEAEGELGARTVAFLGLCIGGDRHRSMYREGAFGGAAASMVPVNEAAEEMQREVRRLHPEVDEVIPLTHQDLPDDVKLAATGRFPVIVAGHDHEVIYMREGTCPIVKSGQDATHAAIIDITWPDDPGAPPEVEVRHEVVSHYEPDPSVAEKIGRIKRPVYELEMAMVYEIKPDEVLTSENVRVKEVTMARLVATALRECLNCDAAIINAGAIRGKKTYTGCLSYGDLKRECPFPSPIVALPLPFETLRRAVHESRRPWWDLRPGEEPKETASALQVDDGVQVDENHQPVTIGQKRPVEDEDHLYVVACDTRVMKRSDVLRDYCERFPDRVPPDDAGRPVLPILAEFFCSQLWKRLIHSAAGPLPEAVSLRTHSLNCAFSVFDTDRNGVVDSNELAQAVEHRLGHRLSSRIVVEQMIAMVDLDSDGLISSQELRHGVAKIMRSVDPRVVSL